MHLILYLRNYLRLINDFPGNNMLTIHNQETAAENELFENRQRAIF